MLTENLVFMPICPYGRSENIFYHSIESLYKNEMPLDLMVCILQKHAITNIVFPSHILDRSDFKSVIEKLVSMGICIRVQIAIGRELDELKEKIKEIHSFISGLDFLVDRPIDLATINECLFIDPRGRFVICPLHFYDPIQVIESILKISPDQKVYYLFLQNKIKSFLLYNADEIFFWVQRISEKYINNDRIIRLRARNLLFEQNEFYRDPSGDTYKNNFFELGNLKKIRFISYYFYRLTIVLSVFKEKILNLNFHSLWAKLLQLRNNFQIRNNLVILKNRLSSLLWFRRPPTHYFRHLYWSGHRFLSFLRYQMLMKIYYQVLLRSWHMMCCQMIPKIFYTLQRVYWLSRRLMSFLRYQILMKIYYQVLLRSWHMMRYQMIPKIFYTLQRVYWLSRRLMSFLRYQILMKIYYQVLLRSWHMMRYQMIPKIYYSYFPIIFWPLFKCFYFLRYQYETRLRPFFLSRRSRSE